MRQKPNFMEENNNKIVKEYELSAISKDEAGFSAASTLIKQHQFEILFESSIKKISLAYEIEKESEAFFGYFHISGNPENIKALNHDLKTSKKVLRFLILTPPFVKSKAIPTSPTKPKNRVASKSEKVSPDKTLTNEALEKKIEEILQ